MGESVCEWEEEKTRRDAIVMMFLLVDVARHPIFITCASTPVDMMKDFSSRMSMSLLSLHQYSPPRVTTYCTMIAAYCRTVQK